MRYSFTFSTILFSFCFVFNYHSDAQPSPELTFTDTISNVVDPLKSPGSDLTNKKKYNKTLFKNCLFTNGLVNIKNIDSLYFYQCTFTNYGVKLGNATTNNITFDNCKFINVTENGIVTNIDDQSDHYNLKIVNCYFEGWGQYRGIPSCNNDTICNPKLQDCERCNDSYNKFDHGIYLRATDAEVRNCEFFHTTGGSAISIRNSAIIIGNKIYSDQTGVGSAIGYWPQYKSRGSKKLVIEKNIIIGYAQNLSLLTEHTDCDCGNSFRSQVILAGNKPENLIDSISFKFNTLVVMDSLENNNFNLLHMSKRIKNRSIVYGNLLMDLRANIYFSNLPIGTTNLTTTNPKYFADFDPESKKFDVTLSANYYDSLMISGSKYPNLDFKSPSDNFRFAGNNDYLYFGAAQPKNPSDE